MVTNRHNDTNVNY